MLLTPLIATGLVTTSCIGHATAGWGFPGSHKASNNVASIRPYQPQPITQSQKPKSSLRESMQNVHNTLKALETLPSCKKTASSVLLDSCETFEDRKNGLESSGDVYLEAFQNLYAIRMTDCEHSNAYDALPDVCEPLLQTDINNHAPHETISACLKAINSDHPTQWTTYNRVKLEGLVMCTAMRAEANKDDQINLLEILFGAMTDVNGVLHLQKEELTEITSNFRGITSKMRDFQDSLLRDNQEIKASMKNFSAELKGSMADIQDTSEALLQGVKNSSDEVLKYFSQVGAEIQLAQSRSDDTEAERTAKLQGFFDFIVQMQEEQAYVTQQSLDAFHTLVYKLTHDVGLANDMTSTLAGKISDVSIHVDSAVTQITGLKGNAQELADLQMIMLKTSLATKETMEETADIASRLFNIGEIFWGWVRSALGQWCLFCAYCIIVFTATLCCTWHVFPLFLSLPISGSAGVIFGTIFSCLRSPTTILKDLMLHFPVFFSPVFWSVLTVIALSILSWETAKQGCPYLKPSRSAYESRLPYSKYESESRDEKF